MKKSNDSDYEKAEMVPMSDFELDDYNGGLGVVVPILVAAVAGVYAGAVAYNAVYAVNLLWEHNYTPKKK